MARANGPENTVLDKSRNARLGHSGLLVGRPRGFRTLSDVDPVRLILSGQNNHDWRSTTPKLKAILEDGGRFAVDITETPGRLSAQSLEPYDVVLSNWNAFGLDPQSSGWPPETRQAYLDFVGRGKGNVVVHAGSASLQRMEGIRTGGAVDMEGAI